MNIKDELIEALQVVDLILVFATMLFTMKYPFILDSLARQVPSGPKARRREMNHLLRAFACDCVPCLVLCGISACLLLPLAFRIRLMLNFKWQDFALLPNAYLMLTLWVLLLLLWSFLLSIKLVKKVHTIKKSLKDDQEPLKER